MPQSLPLVTSNFTVLWLKVVLTVVALSLLWLRYQNGNKPRLYSLRAKLIVAFAVLLSFAVFHSFGKPRGGSFVHHGEMFHYYLGSKYFKELGYYELYNAVLVADAEQDSALANIPFYTDLTSYQNARRETALQSRERVRGLFSAERWNAFKRDVSYFKDETGLPRSPVPFFLMDHGYNASPVSTSLLGLITNSVPVTQLPLLASIDLLLVAAMIALVFRTYGLEMGALFSVYFFVNILNDHGYVSGGLLRYDWLFCLVAAVCLLERGRHAASSIFVAVSALIRIFPALLFFGSVVRIIQTWKATRSVDRGSLRFILAAAVTGLTLFLLPAAYLGSMQPWKDFASKTALHDSGVYVNHLGLRGVLLFEPEQLSLNGFLARYKGSGGDIVRHWQDVKERELSHKRPVIWLSSLLVLAGVTALIWKRKADEVEALLWPMLLIYTLSYLSHYYYAFLCLFALLFFRRVESFSAFGSLCLLLLLNLFALVTDSFSPSPIVFYTLLNVALFLCLSAMLGLALYESFLWRQPAAKLAARASKDGSAKRSRGKRSPKAARRA